MKQIRNNKNQGNKGIDNKRILSTKSIPSGNYCFKESKVKNSHGTYVKFCPYFQLMESDCIGGLPWGYCSFLERFTDDDTKICGFNQEKIENELNDKIEIIPDIDDESDEYVDFDDDDDEFDDI